MKRGNNFLIFPLNGEQSDAAPFLLFQKIRNLTKLILYSHGIVTKERSILLWLMEKIH
jgi:hypothetical protein